MSYQVLARKWRPRTLNEVIGQAHAVQSLTHNLNTQSLHHAYLLTGTRGVGKTTLARILAQCVNCKQGISTQPCNQCDPCQAFLDGSSLDLIEVDAASRTRVEDTREILNNLQYASHHARYKVYLIDEVHMLSTHSFNALLKTLEEPPSHVLFVLATTDPQKLPATVLSRCFRIHLPCIDESTIAQHLLTICQKEEIPTDHEALQSLAYAAQGSMRDALSLMDQAIAFGHGSINHCEVRKLLGTLDPELSLQLLSHVASGDAANALASVAQMSSQGCDFKQVLSQMLQLLHHLAVLYATDESQPSGDSPTSMLLQQLSCEDVHLFYDIATRSLKNLSFSPSARTGFEIMVLRLLALHPQIPTPTAPPAALTAQKNAIPAVISKPAVTPKLAVTPQPVAPCASPTNTNRPVNSDTWVALREQLNLSGAVAALSKHLSLDTLNDHEIVFKASPVHQALINPHTTTQLTQALNQHMGTKQLVRFITHSSPMDTPAVSEQRMRSHTKQQTTHAIYQNDQLNTVLQKLDGVIIENSIKSLNDK